MDFGQIVSLFVTVSENVNDWFVRLINATGSAPFFIACFVVALSVRFLLKPITGGSSDMAGEAYANSKFAAADKARKDAERAEKDAAKQKSSAAKSAGKKG